MGNFYVNFSVKTTNQEHVVNVLRQANRVAVVTPYQDEYIVVYDQEAESQDAQVIVDLGSLLSQRLELPVLAVLNHDDDVLCYWLFEKGELLDYYNSKPDYFDGFFDEFEDSDVSSEPDVSATEQGGDANQLCRVLKSDTNPQLVEAVLRGDYIFAIDQHFDLKDLLGLPSWAVGYGFNDVEELEAAIEQEELIDLEGDEFIHLC